jgi:hypothetical protein
MTGTDGCCNVPSNLHANLYYQEQDVEFVNAQSDALQ